ncbi:class I SAM-dependent methyltransferase [Uliginosibacterium sp. sgz301328]|uniref:class I SAM-dependent methyltransferase n=1 Tax=Uliginosibacterium sp. sgz301328 TaxID=3243764 RepID=UPI00359DDB3B
MKDPLICPVCEGRSALFDVVDFNKSCEMGDGVPPVPSGIAIYYARCSACDFCFAPDMMAWTKEELSRRVYNDEYHLADPDYLQRRPLINATFLNESFGERVRELQVRHLDFGGGNGLMSAILRERGWRSCSYDPFGGDSTIDPAASFDFVTAFEVFEHSTDPHMLMEDLRRVLRPGGIVFFSTLLNDENIRASSRLTWAYAAPRNGHVSLFSRKSLSVLAQHHGFRFGSVSKISHVFYTEPPSWAGRIFAPRQ